MNFNKIVETPMEGAKAPPAGNKGGPGVYDGEKGLPSRTNTPNGVPEKIYDGVGKVVQDRA